MSFVLVSEVGPRHGLQNLERRMAFEAKQDWIIAEAEAGVREIEVGAFVSPSAFPQFADTGALVEFARTLPGLSVAALVANRKGAERAIAAGAHKLFAPLPVSPAQSMRKLGMSDADMLEEIAAIADRVAHVPAVTRPHFEVRLSAAFGSEDEGRSDDDRVVALAEAAIEAGAAEISLSDMEGFADPAQVRRLVKRVKAAIGDERLNTLHLHNRRGLGLANALAAIEAGITTLDASLGGIGGGNGAHGASGNLVTEDLVFMLEAMGVRTGIDLEALLAVRDLVAGALAGEQLYGYVPNAGLPRGHRKQRWH